jgi:Raf kinase inhibitor-like YbhB/YbcL family protein
MIPSRRLLLSCSFALAVLLPVLGSGQEPKANDASTGVLAIHLLKGSGGSLQVSSPSITPGGAIPVLHSDYDQKVSPELRWSGVPPAAKSIALMMEDPDAQDPRPFVHWLLYNIPPSIGKLDEAVSSAPRLKDLGGAFQGRTSRGSIGYFGPRPPKADPPHHYHFQVFALDEMLALDPGVGREALLEAMRGHVVAAGELVGTFKAPADAKQ